MKESEAERMLKPLANRRRLAILSLLAKRGELRVGDVAEKIRLSFTSTSRHLRILESAGFLEKEQHSLEMHYRIRPDAPRILRSVLALL
ncbi:hypothetical protein COU20_01380 [Candidatus Kaiserbacteria bacterium CG10_big_fil_rev_8_21_14_0_10_59_10]|uniref:HTH arsR-type domain-containing protein n=1 Tax=Candidatus Kaiserbacteria bacterium CG10_big_fil_rev_8_21_14_0_10_59_10 TaxID=1974612 RepID=A0A2H0U870_9BACT|nr:MAG: hypothetical protein COU20_01380 [Candidatus Kaiserbacteria bacterium CG10_big_fil_rev_8_21_14_0_10_59_10]